MAAVSISSTVEHYSGILSRPQLFTPPPPLPHQGFSETYRNICFYWIHLTVILSQISPILHVDFLDQF